MALANVSSRDFSSGSEKTMSSAATFAGDNFSMSLAIVSLDHGHLPSSFMLFSSIATIITSSACLIAVFVLNLNFASVAFRSIPSIKWGFTR